VKIPEWTAQKKMKKLLGRMTVQSTTSALVSKGGWSHAWGRLGESISCNNRLKRPLHLPDQKHAIDGLVISHKKIEKPSRPGLRGCVEFYKEALASSRGAVMSHTPRHHGRKNTFTKSWRNSKKVWGLESQFSNENSRISCLYQHEEKKGENPWGDRENAN